MFQGGLLATRKFFRTNRHAPVCGRAQNGLVSAEERGTRSLLEEADSSRFSLASSSAALASSIPYQIVRQTLYFNLENVFDAAARGPFYHFLDLEDLILATKPLRSVCMEWAEIARSICFR